MFSQRVSSSSSYYLLPASALMGKIYRAITKERNLLAGCGRGPPTIIICTQIIRLGNVVLTTIGTVRNLKISPANLHKEIWKETGNDGGADYMGMPIAYPVQGFKITKVVIFMHTQTFFAASVFREW